MCRFRTQKTKAGIFIFPFLSAVLWLASCGNVRDPLPPLVRIPSRVGDLTAIQWGHHTTLKFTLPKLNTDGSTATTINQVKLFRLATPAQQLSKLDLKQFEHNAAVCLSLDQTQIAAQLEEGRLTLTDQLAEVPMGALSQTLVTYALRVFNKKGQDAGYSNLVTLQLISPLAPPEGLHVEAMAESSITLQWKRPARNLDGTELQPSVGYMVYRSETAQAKQRQLLTSKPIEETLFKDDSMALGPTYYYVVRSAVDSAGGIVESFDSAEIAATNPDLYAPKTPGELTAISNGKTVSLVWVPNMEGDLAGYLVWRREPGGQESKLTPKPILSPSYLDQAVEPGKSYQYRVQAIDTHGNLSAFSAEESVEVK